MSELRGRTVVFSGGGTGGHLYPALALADALVALCPEVRPVFVGASRGVEAEILPRRGVPHVLLPVEGFARGRGWSALHALPRLGSSLLAVADLFQALRPEVVVVTGGYAGGPAGIVAGLQRIPLALQEQNAVPGVTTRLLSRWAAQIHVAFPEALGRLPASARARATLTGNPVRSVQGRDQGSARAASGVPQEGVVVLAVGGSQGSAALNRTLLDAVSGIREGRLTRSEGVFLLWSTGPRHHHEVREALAAAGDPAWVKAVPYIDDMDAALAAADVAVSRAGAMATAELLNHGLPAILVPLPTAAADHQTRNAEALAEAGAALVVSEAGITGPLLWGRVEALAADRALRARMAASARERARPDAAMEIAGHIAHLLPRRAA